jgi:hypothetical protein
MRMLGLAGFPFDGCSRCGVGRSPMGSEEKGVVIDVVGILD